MGSAMQDHSKRGWQNAGRGDQGRPAPRKRCEDPSIWAKGVWRSVTPEALRVSSPLVSLVVKRAERLAAVARRCDDCCSMYTVIS
jgi:hypothetical protein